MSGLQCNVFFFCIFFSHMKETCFDTAINRQTVQQTHVVVSLPTHPPTYPHPTPPHPAGLTEKDNGDATKFQLNSIFKWAEKMEMLHSWRKSAHDRWVLLSCTCRNYNNKFRCLGIAEMYNKCIQQILKDYFLSYNVVNL